jgi:hypothetical protein
VNRSRPRTAVLVALPLAVLAVALTLWAGPYWLGVAQHAVAEARWPEQRTALEAAVDAVALPDRFAAAPCDGPGSGAGSTDRCWQVEAAPEDLADDLAAALTAAGVDDVQVSTSSAGRYGITGAHAVGVVADRVVQILAFRELDESPLRTTPFTSTVEVRLTADLTAP